MANQLKHDLLDFELPMLTDAFQIVRNFGCPYKGPIYRDGGQFWQEIILAELSEDDRVQELYQVWIKFDQKVMNFCKNELNELGKFHDNPMKRIYFRLALGFLKAFDHWTHIQVQYGACGGGDLDPSFFHSQIKGDITKTVELVRFLFEGKVSRSETEVEASKIPKMDAMPACEDDKVANEKEMGPESKHLVDELGDTGKSEEKTICSSEDFPIPIAIQQKMMTPLIQELLERQAKSMKLDMNFIKTPGAFETDTDVDGSSSEREDSSSICSDVGLADLDFVSSYILPVPSDEDTLCPSVFDIEQCQGKDFDLIGEQEGMEFLPIISFCESDDEIVGSL